MAIDVGTAIAFLELDTSKFSNGIAAAGADLKNFATGGGLDNLSSAMEGAGSTLTKGVTLPIAGVGAASVKTAMDFEAQMSKVSAIAGATGDDLQGLKDQAIQLGADTTFSASGAAEGMELFASAGFKTNEIMAAMPGILDTAAAGGVTIAQATDVAASALNGFGMQADQVGHIGDVLAKLAGDTNAEIMDTGEAMKYVAPVSKALGISFEDTAASIGLMSNAGIKGSQAGTVLRGALTNLAAPTKGATKLMEKLGMNFFDAQGKMLPMTDILTILKDKTAGLTQQEKASAMETLFGKEAMSGMLAMVDQGPEKFDELSKSLKNCDGSSKEMAGTMSDNLKGSLTALEGSIETAAIKIGEVLSPMVKKAAEWISEMVNKFSALPKPTQELIVKIGLLAAALGPVLIISAKLIESFNTVMGVFKGVTTVMTAVPRAVSGVTSAFSLLKSAGSLFSSLASMITPQTILIVAAIAAIGFVVYEVIKHWDAISAYFKNFCKWLVSLFSGLLTWLKDFFSQWGPAILAVLVPFLGIPLLIWQHWNKIVEWLQPIFDWMCNAFDKVVSFFSNGLKGLVMAFDDFTDWASGIGKNICEGLVNGLEAGWDWVFDKVGSLADKIKGVFTKILDIHSPSRVFRGYGINTMEGYVLGLEDHESKVSNKMTGIANNIKSLGNVSPDLKKLNDLSLGGVPPRRPNPNFGAAPFNFTPNINMQVHIADTGEKGKQQLTGELKSMTHEAMKDGLVNEFIKDAFRL